MRIHRHLHVEQVQDAYGPLLRDRGLRLASHLERLADRAASLKDQSMRWGILAEWRNYLPEWSRLGGEETALRAWKMDSDGFRTTALEAWARQTGFADWAALLRQDPSYDPVFEAAVDALLDGQLDRLRQLLLEHPELAQSSSTMGHQASLLHYASSNGVELWRQQVPENLLDGVRLLRQSGADPEATMHVYGGAHTAFALAASSAHPSDAGIMEPLLALLDPQGLRTS